LPLLALVKFSPGVTYTTTDVGADRVYTITETSTGSETMTIL
jgi:hypothetical protein